VDKINWEQLVATLTNWGILLAKAILVYLVGRIVIKIILRIVSRLLERAGVDEMLIKFARSITNAGLTLVLAIIALSVLGIDTTSLIAVLASAGLAVGLALQDSMKNFASGVLLLTFRPFIKGDLVDTGGSQGVVQEITLFTTTLLTVDNREVIVPNGAIWSGVITNFTARDQRRVDMVFGIGYGDGIERARSIIEQVLAEEPLVLKDPAPDVAVSELADSSVNFVVRPWVKTDDYWDAKFAVTERIKLAFDQQGISIPFPQMDIHMDRVA
jgi:small conductance mechanosensitive channel